VRDYSRKMSLTNPLGDFEVTDPSAMRAMAHPVRLAILTHLQRHGPATATQLSSVVGASPSVTSWHLRHLATFKLVKDWDGGHDGRERWWQTVARGFRFDLPTGDEGQGAYRMLSAQFFRANLSHAQQWFAEVEPDLEYEWRSRSGVSNTRVVLTLEELAQIENEIEKLLAPFIHRDSAGSKVETRGVRLMRFYMPEPGLSNEAR
jgi:DNA-binding transcriptional ArsR family regulator